MDSVDINVQLSNSQAWALAQLLKRATISNYLPLASGHDEAYQMQEAGEVLRKSLAEAGIDPR